MEPGVNLSNGIRRVWGAISSHFTEERELNRYLERAREASDDMVKSKRALDVAMREHDPFRELAEDARKSKF